MIDPPWPPLPPSGPPSGLNFSRLTEATPLPPRPAARCSVTWSTKLGMAIGFLRGAAQGDECTKGAPRQGRPSQKSFSVAVTSLAGDDVDHATTAAGAELDGAGLQGEQGVVATTTHAGARVEVRAALADDDLAGADDLAAEALHAEALRVGVTAVLGARSTLLVSHCSVLR